MNVAATPSFRQRLIAALRAGGAIPAGVLVIFWAVVVYGIFTLPGGWAGDEGFGVILLFFLQAWLIGFFLRVRNPDFRLAVFIEICTLFFLVSTGAALAASIFASQSGALVDPALHAIDKALFPWFDYRAMVLALPDRPLLYGLLSEVYDSFNWQPLALFALALAHGHTRHAHAVLSAWAIGLAVCVLPFRWFPAVSAYPFYGITADRMPGATVSLPWDFLPVFEGMRSGAIDSVGLANLTGMVTTPSFHAASAVILAWGWWRYAYFRWPFLVLNIGMALSAAPIGSHYLIDLVAGVAAGLFSIGVMLQLTHWLSRAASAQARSSPMPEPAPAGSIA